MDYKVISKNQIFPTGSTLIQLNAAARLVAEKLKDRNLHIACAESCTGGLLAKSITDIPGSSQFFECGVVSYSSRIKCELLGVHEDTIKEFGVVSAETAAEMSENVKRISGADIGIGITGVAGPGPDEGKPEGNIFISLSSSIGTYVLEINTGSRNAREHNRRIAATNAFNLTLKYLEGRLK